MTRENLINIRELLNMQKLKMFLESTAALLKMNIFFVDANAHFLFDGSYKYPCERYRNEGEQSACTAGYEELWQRAIKGKKSFVLACHQGMSKMVFPVCLRDQQLGVLCTCLKLEEMEDSIDNIMAFISSFVGILEEAIYKEFEVASMANELSSTYEELMLLYELSQTLNLTQDFDRTVGIILEQAVDTLGAERGFLMTVDPENEMLVLKASLGFSGLDLRDFKINLGEGIIGETAKQGKAKIFNNISDQSIFGEYGYRVESLLCVSLVVNDKIVGVLGIIEESADDAFDAGDLKVMLALANQAATAIENINLYEDIVNAKNYIENILESINTGVITADLDGRLTTFNNAAEIITGFANKEVIGKKFEDMKAFAEIHGLMKQTFNKGENFNRLEVNILNRIGQKIPVGVNTSILLDPNNQAIGTVTVFADLTQVKQLEARLRRADRLSALGQMAAGLAHEIRNPLNCIRGFSQLLEMDFPNGDPRKDNVRIIIEQVNHLNSILTDFLDFSREMRLNRILTDVNFVLEKTLFFIQGEIDKLSANIVKRMYEGTADIEVDEAKLRQVFINIIINALQAMGIGGTITLETTLHDKYVKISIADTGSGMSEEVLDKIFNPFFTTKDSGTGLGLTITHRIIEEHGGTIEVESKIGVGTKFVINLPLKIKNN